MLLAGQNRLGYKAYQSGTGLTPPRVNAKHVDSHWKEAYGTARKCIESAFSGLVGARLRCGQVKTYLTLRLKVALNVLAHNLKFIHLSG
jgi:hypothetical protein